MVTIQKNIPPENHEDDLEERAKDIRLIVNNLDLNDRGEFKTFNINAWRTSFNNYVKNYNSTQLVEKKFTVRANKDEENSYYVWRTI